MKNENKAHAEGKRNERPSLATKRKHQTQKRRPHERKTKAETGNPRRQLEAENETRPTPRTNAEKDAPRR